MILKRDQEKEFLFRIPKDTVKRGKRYTERGRERHREKQRERERDIDSERQGLNNSDPTFQSESLHNAGSFLNQNFRESQRQGQTRTEKESDSGT